MSTSIVIVAPVYILTIGTLDVGIDDIIFISFHKYIHLPKI
jgi:hypothetical protein